jgi:hypothetical protein
MEMLLRIVLMVLAAVTIVALLLGLPYLGYKSAGITGLVQGVFIAFVALNLLYLGARFLTRRFLLPMSQQALDVLKQMKDGPGVVQVSRRHKGKFHAVSFRCEMCGMEQSIRQTIDDRYAFLCAKCGFPHRIVFKSWFAR